MQEGRCRVIGVNADADLDNDLDRRRNKKRYAVRTVFYG